jgi:nitroreductase
MELNKAIQNRHSVRKFRDKKPDWRTIIECVDSVRFAPMAGNNCTLKIILVDDEEKINKIGEATQQDHVSSAKYIVVFCSHPVRAENLYGENSKKWVKQQTGAAIENFLLSIEQSGLATCWVGHFDAEIIKRVLKVPADAEVEAIFPIGFELDKPKTKRLKISIDRILYFNSYGDSKMKHPHRIE